MSPTTRADTAQRPSWRRNVGGAGGGRARSYRRGPDKKGARAARSSPKKGLASVGVSLYNTATFPMTQKARRAGVARGVFLEGPMKGSHRWLVRALVLLASATPPLA